MVGKFLFFIFAATAPFLGAAGAVTTSQNVDIIVTHGASTAPTFTFVNNSGKTLSAGSPVSFGQAFRYGDIMPDTYPLIRLASTHVALAGQQWDEISTWTENGGNGSWRHAVWTAWLPADLAAGATTQFEFIPTAGTYSQTSHQPLSALCAGPAAHDLKIHLTDVRNQDDSVRDSGDATFRVCDNIANSGRDAPRHLRAGNVYDEYVVLGMFVYATSGHKDPLLYAQCNIDIFTKSSDGASPGDVRWVCHVHNPWLKVSANSTGNAGNPGPAGFVNDPQAISYRPEVDDGATDVLDWSGLDATISSGSNPVSSPGAPNCNPFYWGQSICMFVPSSTGGNGWYEYQAARVTCSGGCIGGLANNTMYFMWPASSAGTGGSELRYVNVLSDFALLTNALSGSQGTGSTTFSMRVFHKHWLTWQTMDATGLENWSPFGTTTRVTREVDPALTIPEKTYWEQSGIAIPLDVTQPTPNVAVNWNQGLGVNYGPMGRLNVIGSGAPGARPDLGIVNGFAAKAFITQAAADWRLARLFTLGSPIHGASVFLDESTGRIPPMNNGPPTGPGGNGAGGSYVGLGAPNNQIQWPQNYSGALATPEGKPSAFGNFNNGAWTGLDHMPEFNGFTYMMYGNRQWLDMMQWRGDGDFIQQTVGPGNDLGQAYFRDNNARFTDGNVYHYWGLMLECFDIRGCTWLQRDVTSPATFGADDYPLAPTFAGTLSARISTT